MSATQERIDLARAQLKQDREELNHLSQRAWDVVGELYRRFELIDGANTSAENLEHLTTADHVLTQLRERTRELRRMQRQIDRRAQQQENGVFIP